MTGHVKPAELLRLVTGPARTRIRRARRAARTTVQSVRSLPRVARNAAARLHERSDYSRWSAPENLDKSWETRTKQMAALVPRGSRVIEFGAGSCRLRAYLDESCEYIPSDIVERGPGTVICDLNRRPLPELHQARAHVAFFAGVLEYIRDVESVVTWLSNQRIVSCMVSYDCVPRDLNAVTRLRERLRRLYYGYMSDLTEDQLLAIFTAQGFALTHVDSWTTQRVFGFARTPAVERVTAGGTPRSASTSGEAAR